MPQLSVKRFLNSRLSRTQRVCAQNMGLRYGLDIGLDIGLRDPLKQPLNINIVEESNW